jgi:hypothetical protein
MNTDKTAKKIPSVLIRVHPWLKLLTDLDFGQLLIIMNGL